MSIADKLIYLNTTKDKLKDSINNIGGSITDETTFRQYATELDNIYDNLPKTTGEGSNLSLTTLKGRINVDDILGDTQQEGTPTPDTPIDIEVVTGEQQVLVRGTNLFDGELELGIINGNTGLDNPNSSYIRAKDYIPVEELSTYKFSCNNSNVTAVLVYEYKADKSYNMVTNKSVGLTSYLTTEEGTAYIRFRPNYLTNDTTIKFMVEKGTTASEWQPYQEQTKTLHLGDIELCKIGTYQDRISKSSGKNLFSGFIKGKGISASTGVETTNTNAGVSDYIPVNFDLNSNYYISGLTNTLNSLVGAYNSNKEFLGRTGATTTTTWNLTKNSFTTATQGTGDVAYIRVEQYYLSGNTGTIDDIDKLNVMLNEGSTALPYEPYGTNWYIEKNNIEKDKDYLVAQVGQVDTITNYARIRVSLNNACISTPTGLCSHLKFEASYSGQSNHFYAQGNYAYLIIDKTLLSTIDVTGAKAYLNTLTGLKILYPLATPTYEQITNTNLLNELNELEKMMSYNGQTNINISGNLPMLVSVSALKGE